MCLQDSYFERATALASLATDTLGVQHGIWNEAELLVHVDLPAERVPLGRVLLSISEHRRVQLVQVDPERRSLVMVEHGELADDRVRARAALRPPREVVRAALGHPAELAPAVDVVVDDLRELRGRVERHERVERAERVPAAVERVEVRVRRARERALRLARRVVWGQGGAVERRVEHLGHVCGRVLEVDRDLAQLLVPERLGLGDDRLEGGRADLALGVRACLIDRDEGHADADVDLGGFAFVGEERTGLVNAADKVASEIKGGYAKALRVEKLAEIDDRFR